jgi:hypothetical protein
MEAATRRYRTSDIPEGVALRYAAAGLAVVSQAIHLWIIPEKLVFALLPGLFFLLVAIGQGLLTVSLLFGPGKWALRLGILLNLSVVSVWGVTRLVSLPNVTGTVHLSVGMMDLIATTAEILLIPLLAILYYRSVK